MGEPSGGGQKHDEPAEMALFLAAQDLEAADRAGFVEAIADERLRQRVALLIEAARELGDADPLPALVVADHGDPARLVGAVVDGFRILAVLGRGGMGVVYEAEQAQPRRRVALKTLPPFGSVRDGPQRLEREAALLARLSHPGIATVYGCGRAEAFGGMSYLVMERIDGSTLDRYLRGAEPGVGARLRLLADLADAVGHAHGRGVVHLDLKPANVLVRADGTPKVLDFGIARVVGDAWTRSLATQGGEIVGTLPYMSPEQLRGERDAIDARSDVYSLGVVGFEMLAGQLPIPVEGLSLASAMQRIERDEPRALLDLAADASADVQTVLAKAMEKDAARRYADAADLAADLRRLLADQPIHARAPSRAYLFRKFVRRHRIVCTAIVAVVGALALGATWAFVERGAALVAQATAERIAAQDRQRAASASRMAGVVWDLVSRATPEAHLGSPPGIEEVVDDLAARVDADLADDAFVLGQTHLLLSSAMRKRGQLAAADRHLERARELLERHPLTGARERAQLAARRAEAARDAGRLDLALQLREAAIDAARDAGDRRDVLLQQAALASQLAAMRRELPRAERLIQGVLEGVDPERDPDAYCEALGIAARICDASERPERAVELYEQLIGRLRTRAPRSLLLASTLQNLGLLLDRIGRPERSLPLLREALGVRREVFRGQSHRDLAIAIDNFACSLRDRGQLDEALVLFDEASAMYEAAECGESIDHAICLTERAIARRHLSGDRDARADLQRALVIFGAVSPSANTPHAAALEQMAITLVRLGQADDGEPHARQALAIRREVHGEGHPLLARSLDVLGFVEFSRGRFDDAEAAALESLRLRREHHGDAHHDTWAGAWLIWRSRAARGDVDGALQAIEQGLAAAASRGDSGLQAVDKLLSEAELLLVAAGRQGELASLRAKWPSQGR